MKYVYAFAGIFIVLCGTHLFVYRKAFEAGSNAVKSELHEISQTQAMALMEANKKILDLQRVISNNNDECFGRVWPDEIIDAVNPSLLR